eukprot:TRINITY_DN6891_c0_g1_i1.p3 TRINITY_DN6891_c0_g1~~TRINITY_DN6891_c0_g1_i1.p3  ORF type:complete len:112 (-),score=11.76 TRINITY_DN6891_c0_g1_i1:244-579(-)
MEGPAHVPVGRQLQAVCDIVDLAEDMEGTCKPVCKLVLHMHKGRIPVGLESEPNKLPDYIDVFCYFSRTPPLVYAGWPESGWRWVLSVQQLERGATSGRMFGRIVGILNQW